ncbi:MFS transporter [Flavonifractor sp. An10]|uniref:MFS transporter n=1 Tax=Flavonifractor sp. An10 TaxID=1965537 RepID=UPI001FA8AF7A|nr:MFS transporter [Flavonifractor sp. An10]
MKSPSLRRLDWHYIAMQMGFWAMFAAIVAYQTALLLERGFTNGEAGLMTSVRCLAGIVFQPLLGGFADRHPGVPLKGIVGVSLALSLAAGVWYWAEPAMGLAQTALVWVVIGGLGVSSYPLMDAMAVQFINDGVPIRYSLGRGLGSLAYAVVCVLLGLQVGQWGVETTLVTFLLLTAAEIALVFTYPTWHPKAPAEGRAAAERPQSALSLLRSNPRFTLMLAGVLFGLTAVLPLSNFLVNVILSRGGTAADLGLAMFLMGGFELPAAFLFPKLLRRLGSGRILVLSMAFCTLKGVALLLTWNLAGVLLCQPLQMLGYGLFTPASVYFVNESVPPADRVRGQTIMMVASNGLGGMLGGMLAGFTLDLGGANWMLAGCVACGCVSVLLCLLALPRKRGRSG